MLNKYSELLIFWIRDKKKFDVIFFDNIISFSFIKLLTRIA